MHESATQPGASPEARQPEARPNTGALWVHRFSGVVLILTCIEIGLFLVLLPWTPIWTENNLLARYPEMKQFAMNDFIRGVVSGLGVLDILLGITEAVRFNWTPRA